MRLFLTLGLVLLAAACTNKGNGFNRTADHYLEKDYAELRASLLNNVRYDLKFNITTHDKFYGVTTVNFQLKEAKPITIDFFDGEVTGLEINGRPAKAIKYNKYFITIDAEDMNVGANSIKISYNHLYSSSGSGLYRFVDPEDKRIYIYSDFEPYDAHLVFPCFDQPDLKANFSMQVIAPSAWTVVSATMPTTSPKTNKTTTWTFPESKKFSTYLMSLHAGEFMIWKNEAKTKIHGIPLRLMARQSLAKYVDPEEWFSTTQQGFAFFEEYFDYPYPYGKYDQVIVPDFNSGAMENVAAVTFNENRYVSRGTKHRVEKRALAEVILHEMAHMWFGNLVTMKWWNDIWLNESFATYAAAKAAVNATPYKEEWVDFIVDSKGRAYREDQLVTTHPIEFSVANTDVVFANFDGITYGKGASVLKQLDFYLGEENFRQGLRNYFRKFEFKNTRLSDFIGELAKASGQDLIPWQKSWLQTAQVNTIRVEHACIDGKAAGSYLVQTAPKDYPELRTHKTKVAVFSLNTKDKNKPKFNQEKVFDLTYKGDKTEVPDLNGMDCKKLGLIYPNYEDHDYAKVELNSDSLNSVYQAISKVEDEAMRAGLWYSLWEMVVDKKLPATQYFDIVLKHTLNERSLDIVRMTFNRAESVVEVYVPRDGEWKDEHKAMSDKWTAHLIKGAKQAANADLQKMWFDYFVSAAENKDDLKMLSEALGKKPTWLKFDIDQDRRWSIVRALSRHAHGDYAQRVEKEKARDGSARGGLQLLAAQAVVPKLEVKKDFWRKVSQGPRKDMSLGQIRPVVNALFPPEQKEFHKEFGDEFFRNLKGLKDQPGEFLAEYTNLAPAFCATDSVNRVRKFTEQNQNLPPNVLKRLKIHAQEDERCIGIREKLLQPKQL